MTATSFRQRLIITIVLTASFDQSAGKATAYCRESEQAAPQGGCVTKPNAPFLAWKRHCVTYTFNDRFFARMPVLGEVVARQIVRDSFAAWTSVDCDGRKPFLVEQAPGTTRADKAEFLYDVSNEMVIAARTGEEWGPLPDHAPNAIAVTMLWFANDSGEILDCDIDLNLGLGQFADCVRNQPPCGDTMLDLQNTMTHEAGHVLGLGHSTVLGSTMEAEAVRGLAESAKRTLEDDDRTGYCTLRLPEWQCSTGQCSCPSAPVLASKSNQPACSSSILGAPETLGSLLAWLGLGALSLSRLQHRRNRRTKLA
jgi:hypothetical protein